MANTFGGVVRGAKKKVRKMKPALKDIPVPVDIDSANVKRIANGFTVNFSYHKGTGVNRRYEEKTVFITDLNQIGSVLTKNKKKFDVK